MGPDGSFNDKLDEMLALSRANNRMLKDMRRDALIGVVVKIVIWGAVILGSYYFAIQYLAPVLDMYNGLQEQGSSFQELFEQYRTQFGE